MLSGISEGKVTNLKTPGVFFKKVYPQPPCLDFFWNSPLLQCFLSIFSSFVTLQLLRLAQSSEKPRCSPFSTRRFMSCDSTAPLATAATTEYDISAALSLHALMISTALVISWSGRTSLLEFQCQIQMDQHSSILSTYA